MKFRHNKHGSPEEIHLKKKQQQVLQLAHTHAQQTTEAPIKGRLKEKGGEYLLALTYGRQ